MMFSGQLFIETTDARPACSKLALAAGRENLEANLFSGSQNMGNWRRKEANSHYAIHICTPARTPGSLYINKTQKTTFEKT